MNINNITKNIKILYVEDNENVRTVTYDILDYYFDTITTAIDGLDGLNKYKEFYDLTSSYFDIVVSDITMPNMNGVDMISKMKMINPEQFTVLLTAFGTQEFLLRAIELNVDKFIVKPITNIEKLINPLIDLSEQINTTNIDKEKAYIKEQTNEIIDKNIYITQSNLSAEVVSISQAYLDFTGYTKEDVIGKNHSIFKKETTDKEIINELWKTILQNEEYSGRMKNHKKNGEVYWVDITIVPLFNKDNAKIGYTSIYKDVTNTQRLKSLSITDHLTGVHNRRYFDYLIKKLFKSATWQKEQFGLLVLDVDYFKGYNDFYGHADGDKVLRIISAELTKQIDNSLENIFRIGGEEFAVLLLNKTDDDVKRIALGIVQSIEGLQIEHKKSAISEFVTVSIGAVNVDCSKKTMTTDNLYKLADSNLYRAKNAGRNCVVFDVDKRVKARVVNLEAISRLASRQHLIHEISSLKDDAMLIILHINQVGAIKELYGIDAINTMIYKKSKELKLIITDDDATLYSLNTQEFAILVTNKVLFDKYMALVKYTILTNSYEDIYDESDDEYLVSDFTVGISYGKINLFSHADMVLQDAIITNKNLMIFKKDKTTLEIQQDKLNRLVVYKKALHSNKIIPYFQPIIDTLDNSVLKYEALARLITENGEVISPSYFLDSAKEDNTLEFFTRQVIQKIFEVYAYKKAAISINVTYENMCSQNIRTYIENRLTKYGGNGITFEIVESEDIEDYERIEEFVLMIKKHGCKISIDDFGSGYSNFTNIIKLNVDYIKIDGSLIENLHVDENVEHMVKALLVFAKKANIKTIAEFVSSKEIDTRVRDLGIDFVQGYYYGEPKPPAEYGLIE